jgi:hypothetical protein
VERVEASGVWRKSRRSNGSGNCVEVAPLIDGGVGVRHSKDPDGAALYFTADEFKVFVEGIRQGDFDNLDT